MHRIHSHIAIWAIHIEHRPVPFYLNVHTVLSPEAFALKCISDLMTRMPCYRELTIPSFPATMMETD